jgi:GMP synthase-like glutamine amidotransferase
MRVGKHAWGVQFHVELEENTIENWSKVPAYAQALEETLGDNSLNRMKADAKHYYPGFQRNSAQLFDNFLSLVSASL